MAKLSPIFNSQIIDENGNPATGWKIYTYVAGSSQPQATYTDTSGNTPHPNPIIIDALGLPETGQIWLAEGQSYKLVLKDENDVLKDTQDNISGVNDASIDVSQWVSSGLTPTYVSATSYTVPGDQTTDFHVGRRQQLTVTAGTVYGTIYTSAYNGSSLTTVTMVMDNPQVLDVGLSGVNHSILRADRVATPFANVAETINGVKTFTSPPILPVGTVLPAGSEWYNKPIGEVFYLRDDLAGVAAPPTNNANYRYIKLTAADAYNTGVLTSETVTGSAPLITATAVISLAGSPLNGRTVNLLNTERRFIRAGSSGTLEDDAFQGHEHLQAPRSYSAGSALGPSAGEAENSGTGGSTNEVPTLGIRNNATYGTARIANETRPRSQGATAYMRIK